MLGLKQPSPRSYSVVGPQRQIDERETPHPRVDRGELGEKLRAWRKTRFGEEPFRRIFGGGGGEGNQYNSFQYVMRDVPEGPVSRNKTPVPDPAHMARNIKEIA